MVHTELYIVCSSTWRADGKEAILDSLKNAHKRLVSAVGIEEIPFAIRFHDEQPESGRTRLGLMYDEPRGRAIDQWLERSEEQTSEFHKRSDHVCRLL